MMETDTRALDATDYRILRELMSDGRASDVTLGERVNLSSTATARRRKILEDQGVITGYTANLDIARLGFHMVAIVSIELANQTETVLNEFEKAVVNCPSMSFCTFVSGETDFLMIVHVRSFEDYDRVYRSELSRLPHVARIRSSFMMHEVAQRLIAPIVLADSR